MEANAKDKEFWNSKTVRSKQYFERAKKSILGGIASRLHKGPCEEFPIYIAHGEGSRIYDVDGNEYIDYMGAYGPMILGYCPQAVGEAVIEQIGRGSLFAAPTVALNRLSEKLTEIIPCADLISYQSTGTEANMVVFRFARAFTGKDKIVKFEGHYHGWSDEELVSTSAASLTELGPRNRPWKTLGSAGQSEKSTQNIIVLPWNDLEIVKKTIRRQGHEIAAIVTEPIMANCEPVFPESGFLEGLREVTAENDIVLIFDEIITGFRLSLGGAQGYYKVTPDLCTFGKAAGGGFQIAGVAGKRDIMETGVHPVGTFNANPIAVAACTATINELEKPGVYERMSGLTKRLTEGVTEIAERKGIALYCGSEGSIWQLAFGITERMKDYRDTFCVDKVAYQNFRMGGLERGIKFHPSRGRFYTSAAHTDEDVDKTLSVVDELLSNMSEDVHR
jgi:glutamate-1-semialdehyde 2,1-aminomutase